MDETYTGVGQLQVRITCAGRSLPLKGAEVIISTYAEQGDGVVLYRLFSDAGGVTRVVTLPAPPAKDSLLPGDAQPYAVYNVNVSYEGYTPVENVGLPIFDRVVAVQPVCMLPAPARGGFDDPVMIYETPDVESLQPGGVQREDIGNRNGLMTERYGERGGET